MTTALTINRAVTTDQDHDHQVVSDRLSDRVEHTPALPQLTPHADARRGGDSVLHLAPPAPSRPPLLTSLSASSS
jgi:hypothetical protein